MNVCILMGRLTSDPELKKTPIGVSVTTFTVAVNRNYVKQGEERQSDFIECVAWRNTADFICKYFRKGQMIAVQGSIQTRSYQDKNGNKRKAVEVLADKADFCGDKPNNGANDAKMRYASAPAASDAENDFVEISADGDLPF